MELKDVLLTLAGTKKECARLRRVLCGSESADIRQDEFPTFVLGRQAAAKYRKSPEHKEMPMPRVWLARDVDDMIQACINHHEKCIEAGRPANIHERLIKAYRTFGQSKTAETLRRFTHACHLRDLVDQLADAELELRKQQDKVCEYKKMKADYIALHPDALALLRGLISDDDEEETPSPLKRARSDDA